MRPNILFNVTIRTTTFAAASFGLAILTLGMTSFGQSRTSAWQRREESIPAAPVLEEQLNTGPVEKSAEVNWISLDKYHHTITRKKFCKLLDDVYCPSKKIYDYFTVTDSYVEMFHDKEKTIVDFTLEFAPSEDAVQSIPSSFTRPSDLKYSKSFDPEKPLNKIRITIDPGHIGGKWADTEERSVAWGTNPRIREGDCNLVVGKYIRDRLKSAGAQVYMTHETADPVTPLRTKDFMDEAREVVFKENKLDEASYLQRKGHWDYKIQWQAELFFYRRAEIAQRAENIRKHFTSDLNICNHFNATELSGSGKMSRDNRYAFFINGCYGPDEVENPNTRYFLVSKLLEQPLPVEMGVGDAITRKMLKIAQLPPVRYGREKYQTRVNENPYLYARNLAASRQYPGPTIVLEPFYMNNPWTAERLAAGDYDGVRQLSCGTYRSLFREYADSIADAIIETYSKWQRGR